jgi:hypothetical protein
MVLSYMEFYGNTGEIEEQVVKIISIDSNYLVVWNMLKYDSIVY